MKKLYFLLSVLMAASCVNDQSLIDEMDKIKHTGDSNATLAMEMLDSVRAHLMSSSEYVRKKCELLDTRLRDKAYITHTTDSLVRELVPYFEGRSNNRDKQEVYYYAGSVYRDLQDTPRALEYFLKAEQTTKTGDVDSLLLRNTYSNLHWLYNSVQDFDNTMSTAERELEISEMMNDVRAATLIHIASSLSHLHKCDEALVYFRKAFDYIIQGSTPFSQQDMFVLLSNFSFLSDMEYADMCYQYINSHYSRQSYMKDNVSRCLTIGRYFSEKELLDSAKYYYRKIIDENTDILAVYDASRHLFLIENECGNVKEATKHADTFVTASGRLNLGERQRMAATVNNQFIYYRNAEAEKHLVEESEGRKRLIIIVLFSSLFAITLISAIYNHIRKCQYKVIIEQTEELKNMEDDRKRKEAELTDTKEHLRKKENELANTEELLKVKKGRLTNTEKQLKEKEDKLAKTEEMLREKEELLADMKRKCEEYDQELKRKDTEINERTKQAYAFLGIISQSQMEETDQSIMPTLRSAAYGEHNLTKEEWQKVFAEINSLYPDFKNEIIRNYKSLSEDLLKVCYLVRIGMGDIEIRNATNLPKTTVWRHALKFRQTLKIQP